MKVTAKRRRSKVQIQEDKERAEWEKTETERKIQRLEDLEKEHLELQEKMQRNEAMEEQVQSFIDQGLLTLDNEGNPQVNVEAALASERESQMMEQPTQEPEQIMPNRRQAMVFGMNQLEEDPSSLQDNNQ